MGLKPISQNWVQPKEPILLRLSLPLYKSPPSTTATVHAARVFAPPPRPLLRLRRYDAVAQDLPDQEEAGEEDAPEPPHPLLDPHAHRQHHQVQREAQALAPHQAWVLSVARDRLLCRKARVQEIPAFCLKDVSVFLQAGK